MLWIRSLCFYRHVLHKLQARCYLPVCIITLNKPLNLNLNLRERTGNYIPFMLWDVISCPCRWYLLLAQHCPHFSVTSLYWGTHTIALVKYWRIYSISQEICTRFLLCCALLWLYIDWFSHIHQAYFTGTGNLTIAPVPAKQPWWIWINTSSEFIMNDCITTTKQSTTKPCAYFLEYTVAR